MVDNVLTLLELHVVDLTSRLNPFKAVLVAELRATSHGLIASLDERIFGKLRIISHSHEAVLL